MPAAEECNTTWISFGISFQIFWSEARWCQHRVTRIYTLTFLCKSVTAHLYSSLFATLESLPPKALSRVLYCSAFKPQIDCYQMVLLWEPARK